MADIRPAIPLKRVKKAHEQVADQIRQLVITGEIGLGEKLPSETSLASEFGVSRSTVREALRVLSTQSLVRTVEGSRGGSFITVPSSAHLADSLGTNIGLLSQASGITLEDLLEVREFLEVPAARLAAARRNPNSLEQLKASVPSDPFVLGIDEQFGLNRSFHATLVDAAGNTLLTIAATPIFTVLQTHLQRTGLGRDYHDRVNRDHSAILTAVANGEAVDAENEMRAHLHYLRGRYEEAWKFQRRISD